MNPIDELLDKYFDGETSLQEEDVLREYFRKETIEERHRQYVPMFAFFTHERETKQPTSVKPANQKKKRSFIAWGSIAASILLAVSTFLFLDRNSNQSYVYINGTRISDSRQINSAVLHSLQSATQADHEVTRSQIDILDSFSE